MTAYEAKGIRGERIATFLTERNEDDSWEIVNVSKAIIDSTPATDELYVAASLPEELGAAPAVAGYMTLRAGQPGVREITAADQLNNDKDKYISPRTLAILAETAFRQDALNKMDYSVRVTVPRVPEVTRAYRETLGMRPAYINEDDKEVVLRADVRTVWGFAAEALRVNTTKRLQNHMIPTRPKTAWDEEAA